MKRGELVRGYDGWLGRLGAVKKTGTAEITWETGPLKRKDGLVIVSSLKVDGRAPSQQDPEVLTEPTGNEHHSDQREHCEDAE